MHFNTSAVPSSPERRADEADEGLISPSKRTWSRGVDGGAWGGQHTGPFPPTPPPGYIHGRAIASPPRGGRYTPGGAGGALAMEVNEGPLVIMPMPPMPSVADVPPPEPFAMIPLGSDMRTLRRQVRQLESDLHARVAAQREYFEINQKLWRRLQAFKQNNEENATRAEAQLSQLHASLRRMQDEREHDTERVVAGERALKGIVGVREKRKGLEAKLDEAKAHRRLSVRALKVSRDETRVAEEALQAKSESLAGLKKEIRLLREKVRGRELEGKALSFWAANSSRGLAYFFALLRQRTARQRRIRAAVGEMAVARQWRTCALCLGRWKRHLKFRRFAAAAVLRRQMEFVRAVVVRWAEFATFELSCRRQRRRHQLQRALTNWSAFLGARRRKTRRNSLVEVHRQRTFLSGVFSGWRQLARRNRIDLPRDVEARLNSTARRHWLTSVVRAWRRVVTHIRKPRVERIQRWVAARRVARLGQHWDAWRLQLMVLALRRRVSAGRYLRLWQRHCVRRRGLHSAKLLADEHYADAARHNALRRWRRLCGRRMKIRRQSVVALSFFPDTLKRRSLTQWIQTVDLWRHEKLQHAMAVNHFLVHLLGRTWRRLRRWTAIASAWRAKRQRRLSCDGFRALRAFAEASQRAELVDGKARVFHQKHLAAFCGACLRQWRALVARRHRMHVISGPIRRRALRDLLRRSWSAWSLQLSRCDVARWHRLTEESEGMRELLDAQHEQLEQSGAENARLVDRMETLDGDVAKLKALLDEKEAEVMLLRQSMQEDKMVERSLRTQLQKCSEEQAKLQEEAEELRAREDKLINDRANEDARKHLRQQEAALILRAMQSEKEQMQSDAKAAQDRTDVAVRSLREGELENESSLVDALRVSKQYQSLLRDRQQSIEALTERREMMSVQLNGLQSKLAEVSEQSGLESKEQADAFRGLQASQAVMLSTLSQREASAIETEAMVAEREQEIRNMKRELELRDNRVLQELQLENSHQPSPPRRAATLAEAGQASAVGAAALTTAAPEGLTAGAVGLDGDYSATTTAAHARQMELQASIAALQNRLSRRLNR